MLAILHKIKVLTWKPTKFDLESSFSFDVHFHGTYLENHPRTCKWLGSPPFTSHKKAICKGVPQPYLGGLRITMVINHLLSGVPSSKYLVKSGARLPKFMGSPPVRWWLKFGEGFCGRHPSSMLGIPMMGKRIITWGIFQE